MGKMTDEEMYDFLGVGTRTCHIATIRADGRPHLKPVWFVPDGGPESFTLLFNTSEESVAGRNLARDPRISVSVDDPQPPYSYVVVEGTAELISDLDAVVAGATTIGGRYMGADRADEFGKRNGVPGELLVRVTPNKIIAIKDLAG